MHKQVIPDGSAQQGMAPCLMPAISTPNDEAAARADVAYNRLKNSGELRRLEDAQALAIQIREGLVQ